MCEKEIIHTIYYRYSGALSLENPTCVSCSVRFTLDTEIVEIHNGLLNQHLIGWVEALCIPCGEKWADRYGFQIQVDDGEL